MSSEASFQTSQHVAWSRVAWSLLALFIIVGSAGTWSAHQPGIWAPFMIKPIDVARNVALYVPFGFLGMLALQRSGLRGVMRVTGLALLFSCANEVLQLYTVDRVGSVTDIVSAAIGTIIGASVIALFFSPR
jgi:glycopeptide antibiotics resistance protein